MVSPVVEVDCYEIWLFGPDGFAQQVDECGSHCSYDRAKELADALETWLHTWVVTPPLRDLSARRRTRVSWLMMPYALRERGTAPVDPAAVDVCVIPQSRSVWDVRAPVGSRYHVPDQYRQRTDRGHEVRGPHTAARAERT